MTEVGTDDIAHRNAYSLADAPSHSRGAFRPSFALLRRPHENKGAGKAGRRWHPQSRVCERTRTGWTTGVPEHPGLPCADGFNGVLRALPGERCTIAPVTLPIADARARSGRHITAALDAQTPGVRTTRLLRPRTSPSAFPTAGVRSPSRPNEDAVSAVSYRAGRCSRDHRPAANSAHRRRRVHRPLPASRDDRETPLVASLDASRCTAETEFL
jgi:hypothetical protein